MRSTTMCFVAALTVLTCGCGPHRDEDDDQNITNQPVSAEGKAEEGKISIKAPGVDMTISVPKEITGNARASRDSKILYPGASLAGMAIAAGEADKNGGGDTDVEMRFRTADSPDKVVAWYRDPARSDGFHLDSAGREGDSVLIAGTQIRDGHKFKVRLSPGPSGGTIGRLTVHHSG